MTKKHAQGEKRRRVTRKLSEPISTENIIYLALNVVIDAGTPQGKRIVEKCCETLKLKEE